MKRFVLAWLAISAASVAAAQPTAPSTDAPATTVRAVPVARLTIPDEIAPAIVPYVNCLMASRGVPVRSSHDGPIVPPSVPAGADCAPARHEAARRADAMLVSQHRGSLAQRASLIERTLASVDSFATTFTTAPPAGSKPDASNR